MVTEVRRFLVAVDVTSQAFALEDGAPGIVRSLAAHADLLSRRQGVPFELVTVLDHPEPAADLVDLARARLEQVVAPLFETQPAEIVVLEGKPWRRIIDRVEEVDSDLVMVAARKATMLERAVVGSQALQLLRRCPCPVWVTPRRPPSAAPVLLTATALGRLSAAILRSSARIAQELGGRWHVLHVPEYPLEGGMRLRNAPADEVEAYEREERDRAWEELHLLVDPLADEFGVTPKLWMSEGHPSEQVILASHELQADLVVMGSIGRTGLAGMVLGNTAEKVVRQLECSLLCLKPDDAADPTA